MAEQLSRRILVVDDESMIRELLELMLAQDGYVTDQAESAEEALTMVVDKNQSHYSVLLIDMQLPGITGDTLVSRLRAAYGSNLRLIGMSASQPEEALLREFDAFLKKPFDEEALKDVLNGREIRASKLTAKPQTPQILNQTVYERLAGSMSRETLDQLYKLFLNDCHRRIEVLHQTARRNDDAEYRRQGHAIRGSCGMVGAIEVESLAESIEQDGLVATSGDTLNDLTSALEQLEGILGERRVCITEDNHEKGGEEKAI